VTIKPSSADGQQPTEAPTGKILEDTKSAHEIYDEDYFIYGRRSKKSLYDNYRWLPSLTVPMAQTIVDHCGIELDDTILDFGCARGYLVKALVSINHIAYGHDVSKWALEHADPSVASLLQNNWPTTAKFDWIIAKDVLEHIPLHGITHLIRQIAEVAQKGIFVVVPLAKGLGLPYVVPEYEKDVTHAIRWPLDQWVDEFIDALDHNWEISARYRIKGIKDNYAQFEKGNGFITCKRIG